jgi:5,5'-dehydrodivanillate O-demethylase
MSTEVRPPESSFGKSAAPRKRLPELYEDFASTGPGTLNGRYMRQFWHPLERSELLPPGRAKPIRVMSEDFTLYRGEDGVAHVVAYRCPHRGTQLSVGFVEGGDIRCLYHGWKFNGGGQCVEMPAESDEFAAKVRIGSYPTREHIGLIFAYFGEGEPPPFPHVPGFAAEALIETNIDFFKCNFFQSWENDWDEYHVAWTHRTGGVHVTPELSDERIEEADFGVVKRSRKSDGTTRTSVFFWPATIRLTIPSPSWFRYRNAGPALRETYIIHVPVDDENHKFYVSMSVIVPEAEREAYLVQYREYRGLLDARPAHEIAEEVIAGKKTLADVHQRDEYPFMAVIEDMAAQPGQGRIVDRGDERLGRSDKGVILLRKLWARELQAFAETGKSKAWQTLDAMPDLD